MLMDHLSKWVQHTRQDVNARRAEGRRSRTTATLAEVESQLLRVDSVISSIEQDWMANAAFQCRAYARSLMSFERHIVAMKQRGTPDNTIQLCYERLHEIYASLDEPDGMEGVATLIVSPTLEHQIRRHETAGHWTSAQSCWELRLQESPDNLDYHLGLLRCLRNLGHYGKLTPQLKEPCYVSHHSQILFARMSRACSCSIRTGQPISRLSMLRVPGSLGIGTR